MFTLRKNVGGASCPRLLQRPLTWQAPFKVKHIRSCVSNMLSTKNPEKSSNRVLWYGNCLLLMCLSCVCLSWPPWCRKTNFSRLLCQRHIFGTLAMAKDGATVQLTSEFCGMNWCNRAGLNIAMPTVETSWEFPNASARWDLKKSPPADSWIIFPDRPNSWIWLVAEAIVGYYIIT